MPESKSRHPHKHPQHHAETSGIHSKPKKTNSAIIVAVLFFGLLGLGISFFINGSSIPVLLAGAVTGGLAGFLFGYQINKRISKK